MHVKFVVGGGVSPLFGSLAESGWGNSGRHAATSCCIQAGHVMLFDTRGKIAGKGT